MANNLPPVPVRLGRTDGSNQRDRAGTPDPIAQPQAYDAVLSRRVFAWAIDLAVYFALWLGVFLAVVVTSIVSFGLLSLPGLLLLALLPLLYHALCLSSGGRGTLGMRMMGLQVQTMDGGRCEFVRAALHWILFHLSIGFTGGLILLVALFNPRRRLFHDFFTDVIVLRRQG